MLRYYPKFRWEAETAFWGPKVHHQDISKATSK